MSYSFHVAMHEAPPLSFFDELGFDDLCWCEEFDGETLPEGYWHLYRDQIFTRGLEVCFEDGTLQTRIMTGACREEYELALLIMQRAASISRSEIESEDGECLSPQKLFEVYDVSWVANMVEAATAVFALSEHSESEGGEGVIAMFGPVREFYVGPRIREQLRAGGKEGLADRLLHAIRRAQYIDPEQYYPASAFAFGDSDEERLISLVSAETGYVIPAVELIAVSGEPPVTIALADFLQLSQLRWQWLDERQVLLEPVAESDWATLHAAAKEHEVDMREPEPKSRG